MGGEKKGAEKEERETFLGDRLRRGCVENDFSKKIRKGHEKKAQNAAISPLLFLCNKGKYLPARDQWRFRVSSSANRMTMLNGGIDDLDAPLQSLRRNQD